MYSYECTCLTLFFSNTDDGKKAFSCVFVQGLHVILAGYSFCSVVIIEQQLHKRKNHIAKAKPLENYGEIEYPTIQEKRHSHLMRSHEKGNCTLPYHTQLHDDCRLPVFSCIIPYFLCVSRSQICACTYLFDTKCTIK